MPITDAKVGAVFDEMPDDARETAMVLRGLIFDEAAHDPQIGTLTETLKWGQPAYLTAVSKSGTTLRIGIPKSGGCAIYAHCATNVIRSFADAFPGLDKTEGNRAVHFENAQAIDPDRIRFLIRHALTYHL